MSLEKAAVVDSVCWDVNSWWRVVLGVKHILSFVTTRIATFNLLILVIMSLIFFRVLYKDVSYV